MPLLTTLRFRADVFLERTFNEVRFSPMTRRSQLDSNIPNLNRNLNTVITDEQGISPTNSDHLLIHSKIICPTLHDSFNTELFLVVQNKSFDFRIFEYNGHRLTHAMEHHRIVQLREQAALKSQPFGDTSSLQINDLQATLRLRIFAFQSLLKWQTPKRTISGLRKSHNRIVSTEGETSQIAGTEGDWLERPVTQIHRTEFACARIQDPQSIAIPAWRVRHG